MAKFTNVSPLGALDVPALGRVVEAGETFEVPADLVENFADQPGTFHPVATATPRPKAKAAAKPKTAVKPKATAKSADEKGAEHDNAA